MNEYTDTTAARILLILYITYHFLSKECIYCTPISRVGVMCQSSIANMLRSLPWATCACLHMCRWEEYSMIVGRTKDHCCNVLLSLQWCFMKYWATKNILVLSFHIWMCSYLSLEELFQYWCTLVESHDKFPIASQSSHFIWSWNVLKAFSLQF